MRSNQGPLGEYHVRLREQASISRSFDLGSYTEIELRYCVKLRSFENGDAAEVWVDQQLVRTFVNGQDDNLYHCYTDTISVSGPTATVTFEAKTSSRRDYVYVDNVEVVGTGW